MSNYLGNNPYSDISLNKLIKNNSPESLIRELYDIVVSIDYFVFQDGLGTKYMVRTIDTYPDEDIKEIRNNSYFEEKIILRFSQSLETREKGFLEIILDDSIKNKNHKKIYFFNREEGIIAGLDAYSNRKYFLDYVVQLLKQRK